MLIRACMLNKSNTVYINTLDILLSYASANKRLCNMIRFIALGDTSGYHHQLYRCVRYSQYNILLL